MLKHHRCNRWDTPPVTMHEDEALEHEAVVAIRLAEKWGMVAGVPDGEDKAGRQKVRLMTPQEITERAFETSKLMMEKARLCGLVYHVPLPKPRAKQEPRATTDDIAPA